MIPAIEVAGIAMKGPQVSTMPAAARGKTRLKDAIWRLLAGPSLSKEGFSRLRALAVDGIVIERARADFAALLANCTLSISQGGYNTAMDVWASKVRAVIAPYAGGRKPNKHCGPVF